MYGEWHMSNTEVKDKNVRLEENETSRGWILLAEDAERDAERARQRSDQLLRAAAIFKETAESGMPFPVEVTTRN
jgi:hypothetical protein